MQFQFFLDWEHFCFVGGFVWNGSGHLCRVSVKLSLKKREAILQKWSRETLLLPLRIAFLLLKIMCLFVYFSWSDENSSNPAWEAIGYQVEAIERETKREKERPLEKGIIEIMNEDESSLKESLVQKGINVAEDENENVYKIKCDVVIIGSGCGGGVAAAVLAKWGQQVLILEKGHYFVPEDCSGLEGPAYSELYESGGMLTTQDGKIMVMAGATVGGGSHVNLARWIRTPDYILKEWSKESKIHLFGSHEYQSAMDAVCERIGVTENCVQEGFQNQVLRRGCEGLGLKVEPVSRNSSADHYCGSCCCDCRRGEKKGTDSTQLVDAVKDGAVILTGCKAETLVLVKSEEKSDIQAIVVAEALGPALFAAFFPWVSRHDMNDRMTKYARTAVLFALTRDHGSGEVRKQGHIKYRMSALDKENLKMGLRRALRILVGAGAAEVETFRSDGQRIRCKGTKNEDLEEYLDTITAVGGPRSRSEYWTLYSSAHQMSSCRTGANEEDGAVDENGECWEATGLFVCDGSVLPTAIGVNPIITTQSTAYCISKRLADSLKEGKLL
ncbi:UNVERIFIED_CONTAM: Long-chain-alcohol oxidase FAO2 [Sesamum radiatum]|uniref:long-chain-alcohol oxidase n=1 Tax=Sesamum radiatum TaxID=300843 RepID=A0AAW2W1W0_SESRA